jgi:hypothetical protein
MFPPFTSSCPTDPIFLNIITLINLASSVYPASPHYVFVSILLFFFLPLRTKCFPQEPILRHFQVMFDSKIWEVP